MDELRYLDDSTLALGRLRMQYRAWGGSLQHRELVMLKDRQMINNMFNRLKGLKGGNVFELGIFGGGEHRVYRGSGEAR